MIATLGGLTFVGDGAEATYTISLDGGFKGWFAGVEMRRELIAKPDGIGDFPSPGYLGSRLITLSGLILTADAEAQEIAMKALEDLLDDGGMDTLTVEQATGTYTIEVGRVGTPETEIEVYGTVASYQLHLWAPIPTKVLVP